VPRHWGEISTPPSHAALSMRRRVGPGTCSPVPLFQDSVRGQNGRVKSSDRERAADALREVVEQIDAKQLEATDGQRAYIAGAVQGLTGDPRDTTSA
jgi:hypothetical protein